MRRGTSAADYGHLVLAKSAPLHFRLTAKITFAPLLVLSHKGRLAFVGPPAEWPRSLASFPPGPL